MRGSLAAGAQGLLKKMRVQACRKINRSLLGIVSWVGITLTIGPGSVVSDAQVNGGASQAPPQAPQLPVTTQIKKTIVFIQTECLHDFSQELVDLTPDQLSKLAIVDQRKVDKRLAILTWQLRQVKASSARLGKPELANLEERDHKLVVTDTEIIEDIQARAKLLLKMMAFKEAELHSLSDQELSLIPLDTVSGTGFLVGLIDPRLRPIPGQPGFRYFRYVVTNRHVAEPGVEKNMPCKRVATYMLLNHKPDVQHPINYTQRVRVDSFLKWVTPENDSVDLAAATIGYNDTDYDQFVIPSNEFATQDEIQTHRIVEGDPILFAGLFIQTFDASHTLEPIVRSGTLAMVPGGLLPTTLGGRQGNILLADAHVFSGNSGSPAFVDPTKYSGIIGGPNLELLGVISGEVFEGADLTLNVTTSVSGNIAANSGVSVLVPVTELVKLLDNPGLKSARDAYVDFESKQISSQPK